MLNWVFAALAGDATAATTTAVPHGREIVLHGSASGAPACTACHGGQLQGNTALKAPSIAGRPAEFIIARLVHYASPDGHNAMMKQVATALSPEERRAVGAYIATLPKGKSPGL